MFNFQCTTINFQVLMRQPLGDNFDTTPLLKNNFSEMYGAAGHLKPGSIGSFGIGCQ